MLLLDFVIFASIDVHVPEVAISGSAKLTGLLLASVSLGAILQLKDLTCQLFLGHLVDFLLRILVLYLADDVVTVSRWLRALLCLLR